MPVALPRPPLGPRALRRVGPRLGLFTLAAALVFAVVAQSAGLAPSPGPGSTPASGHIHSSRAI